MRTYLGSGGQISYTDDPSVHHFLMIVRKDCGQMCRYLANLKKIYEAWCRLISCHYKSRVVNYDQITFIPKMGD